MKNLFLSCSFLLSIIINLTTMSCKEETVIVRGTTDILPVNVRMLAYTNSSITVGWDHVEGATSYTIQLLDSKDSDKPLDRYIVITEDFYKFSSLEELKGYYVRVRANVNYDTGDWKYIMNNNLPARIMPKYGFVADDFKEPDVVPSTELYPNFPEGWEIHTAPGGRKPSFTAVGPTGANSDIFPSGEWLMEDIYSISTASMVKNRVGDYAVMFRGGGTYTPKLAMNFDLTNGASKFSFIYGAATQNATDAGGVPIYVKVEYSQDAGKTWTQLEDILEVASAEIQYYKEYELNIKGPVRFRIGKTNTTAARLLVDEIAVYKN
ncbi:fibronectin type III domain-containing protein [Sphingobacterium faecale]|uniref:Fibronectin type III domain-containing protein n=1 Tax=Sphingobacterium faecale TaxID=2803775 RepID=A0ABS1R518_9SPHI|nr:fibronectin type III domain-containing protein [Sphingobacterium faecale]MBL1409329.1 fibronectin type III domain-containing protein [Sphingobacterium faecale]